MPAKNIIFVLQSLTHLPYEPLKLLSDRHLTLKRDFLLALALAKRASSLHGLSYKVKYTRSCPVLWLRPKTLPYRK